MPVSPASPLDPAGYAFGEFLVDPVKRLIWRNQRVVALTGKTFDLLLILIRHRDRVLEKEELLRLIWPDAIVQENNLVRQMSNLRRALGQRPDQHDVVVTISGRGYRFVAETVELDRLPAALPFSTGTEPAPAAPVAERESHAPAASVDVKDVKSVPTAASSRAAGLVAVAAVTAIVAVAIYGFRPESVMGAPRSLSQLTYGAGLQHSATWAPDGQRLAYAADTDGNSDIWIQSTSDPTPRRLTTSPAADWQPAWSPDGQRVAFRSEREPRGLYTTAAGGGPEIRLTDFGYRPRWSPDGRFVLFDDVDVVGPKKSPYVIAVGMSAPERVRPDLTDAIRNVSAGWHPDGRVSLLGRKDLGWQFITARLGTGEPVASEIPASLLKALDGVELGSFVWATSGRFVFFEGRQRETSNVWRVAIDPASLAWKSAERLTTTARRDSELSLNADGSRLAFTSASETTRLWAFPYDPGTGRLTAEGAPVTSGGAGEFDAAVTQDGSKLAYRTRRINQLELWQHSLSDDTNRLLLTTGEYRFSSPRWSRDGTRLAYLKVLGNSPQSSPGSVALLDLDTGREQIVPLAPSDRLVPDDWSPDGKRLLGACLVAGAKRHATCVVPIDRTGDPAVPLRPLAADPNRDLICQRFSPDQRWISFMAYDGGRSNVSTLYVMPAAGGTWVPITDGAAYDDKPRWSGDGRTIFFLSNRDGMLNLWARRFDLAAGQPVGDAYQVTRFTEAQRRLPEQLGRIEIGVSSDRIFLPISETSGKIWILDHVDR